jgi:hypothetical protein
MLRILLASGWLVLIPAGFLRADSQNDPNEPPLVGQPENFSGAVGSYKITASAQPTELQAEDPLTFTVRITGHGPAGHLPTRPNLRRWPTFAKRFVVEDLDQKVDAAAGVWEFRYRLRPRNPEVADIPALRYVYFKPGLLPREKGYRSAYSESIALVVKPRAEVQATDVVGKDEPSRFPDAIFEIAEGSATVLRREGPFASPGTLYLGIAVLLATPFLCGGWYLVWRRLYPDAARSARRRRSRAAQVAIRSFEQAGKADPDRAAQQFVAIMTDYLHSRWDLASGEPTPAEVADHLRRIGCPAELAERMAGFFHTCDRVRFAPGGVPDRDRLRATAAQIILDLEGPPWPAPVA